MADRLPILDYQQPLPLPAGRGFLRTVFATFGLAGIAVNSYLVFAAFASIDRASDAHKALVLNPNAFGREIEQSTIASLAGPPLIFCLAQAALILGAVIGTYLAVTMLIAAWKLKSDLESARRRLRRYVAQKWVGAIITALSLVFASELDFNFWTRATRHYPVGGNQSVIIAVPLLIGALVPWWLARRAIRA